MVRRVVLTIGGADWFVAARTECRALPTANGTTVIDCRHGKTSGTRRELCRVEIYPVKERGAEPGLPLPERGRSYYFNIVKT